MGASWSPAGPRGLVAGAEHSPETPPAKVASLKKGALIGLRCLGHFRLLSRRSAEKDLADTSPPTFGGRVQAFFRAHLSPNDIELVLRFQGALGNPSRQIRRTNHTKIGSAPLPNWSKYWGKG